MFESIGRSFSLVKTSWNILMSDKKLLAFPALSGIVTILVILTFILPLIVAGAMPSFIPDGPVFFYGILFVYYAVSYFVVIFFNTALISCVNARLQGKDMSVGEGLSVAGRHIHTIFAWALVSATVGIILHLIEERSGIIGEIAGAIIGGAWSLVTFFVVPVLVLEDKGVFDSLKESFGLVKKTWGESIVGSASIGIIFGIIGAVGLFCFIGALFSGSMILIGIVLALFLVLIAILAVLASAMQGIFVTALYTYAKTGKVPDAFEPDLIRNAFVPKQNTGNI